MEITQEQAQAIIDAWDEGQLVFSTGRQDEVAQQIVDDLQEQCDEGLVNCRILVDDWDINLTLMQMLAQV